MGSLGALLLAGCPDDGVTADGDESTGGDESSTGAMMTTLPPPTTADSSGDGSDSGDSGTTIGDETDGTTTDDTTTDDTTTDDTTMGEESTTSMATCGDETVEGGEVCDGSDLGGEDCVTQGFDGGTLGCLEDCTDYDTTGCFVMTCGNDTVEGAEACDGMDLGGEDCVSQGFDGGTLGCLDNCTDYDTTGCFTMTCGNDTIEGMEACDGMDLAGEDCVSQGFDAGVLGCLADCSDHDTSGCSDVPSCVEENIGSAIGDALVVDATVGEDEDLGQSCAGGGAADYVVFWTAPSDGVFVFDLEGSDYDTALSIFSDCSEASEIVCDDDSGTGLISRINLSVSAGEPLVISVNGFSGNTGNFQLNINELVPEGACCAANGTPGCGDTECNDSVCAGDPFCCESAWDQSCADTALASCTVCTTPDICGNGTLDGMGEACDGGDLGGEDCVSQGFTAGTLACADDCSALDTSGCVDFEGSCCVANGTPGCDDSACVAAVCATDPFCCDVDWAQFCADQAAIVCAECMIPDICGNNVTDGTDVCDGLDLNGEDCLSQGFDGGTLGCLADCSNYDTTGCGDFGGDCCSANGTIGCDDGPCTTQICAADPFCCDNQWDGICADAANMICAVCQPVAVCGDDMVVAPEVCDGPDLAGEDCTTQGFIGGALACNGTCDGFDTAGCVANSGGDCCTANGTPGCDDLTCVGDVCDANPSCCDTAWTQACADLAGLICLTCGGLPPLVNGSFETGDFTGWDTQDLTDPFDALQVGTAGSSNPGLFAWAPTDGSFSAHTGFDGNGATSPSNEITIGQEVTLPAAASATLEFDYRVAWEIFGGTAPRELNVRIEQPDGTPIATTNIVTAMPTSSGDTMPSVGNVDLTPYLGTSVRIVFVFVVPDDFSGPGQAELDDVNIIYG